MTWFAAGATVVSMGVSAYGQSSAAKDAVRQANATSKAEGEAIAKERLNTTIRNSYSTALSQMQLGLKKKQAAQQSTDIRASALMAAGDADTSAAATGTIGASTAAIAADIDMKAQAAIDATAQGFEADMENYNNDLSMMVLNTAQGASSARAPSYVGPSGGQILASVAAQGVASFASQYAQRKMTLGLGPKPTP